ncbi:hypothetical protein FDG66_gp23 [Streptomyces phage phiCAM]|uniref:Tail fiber protein n=1 Tax=Streptomyces phage phiCAM TaxID=1239386 RepID=K4NZK1_9CAUD|nr:hypothetical protein FDG66_gp23 [Streptomyces phage phiCAM]AFV51343.1 hypothetical protein [Streptomyces phage phiCAM]
MGFNVVPSPEVSGLTGAPGPQGLKGDVGSSILTGTTVPLNTTGVDGDWYFMEDTRTFLGVTSTTFTIYKKAAGAWSVVGNTLGGSKWYVNTASTSSTDTKPGDMLLRTDTGDIWQRSASGWGSAIGNIKGPQGIQGIQGIQGVAGPQGPEGPQGVAGPAGPAGGVVSVNGKTDVVTLSAGDVGAMPTGGGAFTGDFSLNGASGSYRQWSLDVGGVKRWTFQKDDVAEDGLGAGSNFRLSSRNDDGTFKSTIMYADRGTGQVAIGTTSPYSNTKLSAAGAIGMKDIGSDPTTTAGGVAVYSKGGKLYAKEGGGAVTQIVNSSPTFDDFMVINATADTNYGIVAMRKLNKKRWMFAVSGASETGSDTGSNFMIQSYTDAEADKTVHLFGDRATGNTIIGGSTVMNGARLAVAGGALGIADQAANPTSSSLGSHFYSKAGRPWVQRGSGASPGGALAFELQPRPDEFLPEDLGLKAWTGDPAACVSTGAFCGSGPLRIAAVNLRQAQSISKIAWHFLGYAGGLQTGSWAAVFNTSGTRMAYTNDISTAGNEPAEQHGSGGGTSFVPLTATWSATPGIYYIAWRFIYNTTTGDGPMCLQYENAAGAPPNVFGLGTPVKRFGYFPSTSATPPTSIAVANMENGANRFWAALA